MEVFIGEMRRMVRVAIDSVNERLKHLETRMKIKHPRRQDRRRNIENEYDVRRQEKHAPTFVKNLLREFDCVIERLKESVEKKNTKRESEEEKKSEE